MKENRIREVLAAGRIPVGHMLMEFSTRGVAKLLEFAGIQPGSLEQAEKWIELGYNLISFGADIGVYRKALKDSVEALRATSPRA